MIGDGGEFDIEWKGHNGFRSLMLCLSSVS